VATDGTDQPLADEPLAGRTVAGDWLADRLDRLAGGVPQRQQLEAALRQFAALDRAVYQTIASVPTPALDVAFRRLSRAADKSKLWLAIAAGLAIVGGPTGRRAAARGVLSIGATSALVNIGVKSLWPRRRPDRAGAGVPDERHVRMPGSTSFPSGHSASAFAFTTAVGHDLPALALGLNFLAAAVAYSRVHTGVHYPGDAVVGAVIGASTSTAVSAVMDGFTGS
jgi:undecaprenyl-diphosphatase